MDRAGIVTGPAFTAQEGSCHLRVRQRHAGGQQQNEFVWLNRVTLCMARAVISTEIALIAGGNGIFQVTADDKIIFSKPRVGRFPDEDEVIGLLRKENIS